MELLRKIYNPIQKELDGVDNTLRDAFRKAKNSSIVKVTNYLLKSPGKRLRPALVILSAKATLNHRPPLTTRQLTNIAAAIELIHTASLIHDDIVDHAALRHNKPSINAKWGEDVSIALGDYLYSVAFELVSSCDNTDILFCINQATKAMCEGELIQICERDNFELLKEHYIIIVKKKTAGLFAASCQAGAIASNCPSYMQSALKMYGLNFGIAFQIVDDYLDLTGEEQKLGKAPGQDISVGEITLPLLNLLEAVDKAERNRLQGLLRSSRKNYLKKIRAEILASDAISRTKDTTLSYINSAKKELKVLPDSDYRKSLFELADFIVRKGFSRLEQEKRSNDDEKDYS